MKKKYLGIFLVLLVVGAGIYYVVKSDLLKTDEESDQENIEIVDLDEEEDTDTEDIEEEEEDTDAEEADFSDFSEEIQSTGEENDEVEYSLSSIKDESLNGYHKFTFAMSSSSEGASVPYVVVEYKSSLGSIRVDLNQTTSDTSGIAYQGSRKIDVEGISRIYHNISSDNTEELYDIGVSESTPFYVYSEEISENSWNIIVEVKYPGESDLDIDLGSTEMSSEPQSIEGSTSDDGAAVTGYSYSVSGGKLIFVWTVTGSSSKPIPFVSAELGDDGILDVAFKSLSYDKVRTAVDSIELPGGIGFTYSKGAYHFEVGSDVEFMLSASTSPNQVELTVNL